MVNPWFQTINSTDVTSLFGVMNYSNTVSGGLFMPIMLLVIGMIAIIGTAYTGKSVFRGLVYSGFICSILSILMVLMSWLNPNYMYFCFLLTAIGLVGVRFSEAPS